MMHTCKKCGKQFEDDRKQAAVCYECRTAVCVICGKRFEPTNKGQLTCSQKCSGIRKSQLGIAAKAASTKPTEMKVCQFCGKEFLPRTFRQVYCDGPHYRECIICGKPIQLSSPSDPTFTCSMECRTKSIQSTCLEKYGNVNVLNSDYGREKAAQTCLDKYGVDHYSKTEEYKQSYKNTMQNRYGVNYPLQNVDILERTKHTNQEKYGGNSPSCSDEVKAKAAATVAAHYGGFGYTSNELRQRIEATNLAKYGVKHIFASEAIRAKIRQTLLDKYGSEYGGYSVAEIRGRIESTNLAKYGTKNAVESDVVKERIRHVMIERYGVPNIMDIPEYRQKARENNKAAMQRKYGVDNPFSSSEVREKIKQTFLQRYGVPYYTYMPECHTASYSSISSVNRAFLAELEKLDISAEAEFGLQYDQTDARHTYYYDIHLMNSNLLVELDPTYTHNSFANHWGSALPEDYHLRKTSVAVDHGYRCIHVFDWDDWSFIIPLLTTCNVVYARRCNVEQISQLTADQFTEVNHLQGRCRGQVINYGLYLNDELVEIMTFGKPRYNKKYDLELLRLCSLKGVRVTGGASKLFKKFKEENPDKSVISYCNLAKFTGEVYEKIGMKLDHISPPAKVWSKGDKFITDNMLRSRGYDQIFGTHFGKGTDNEALMLTDGWLPVYDCGQAVYVYEP